MPTELSSVAAQYQATQDAMSVKERIARSAALFQWMREMIGREIAEKYAADGVAISAEELKLRVALRIYGSDPAVVALIQRRLENVCG